MIYGFFAFAFMAATGAPLYAQGLPQTVKTRSDIVFKIPFSPQQAQFLVKEGTEVQLKKIQGKKLLLEHELGQALVEPHLTDLNPEVIAQREAARATAIERMHETEKAWRDNISKLEKQGIIRMSGKVFQSIPGGYLLNINSKEGDGRIIMLKTSQDLNEGDYVEAWVQDTKQKHNYTNKEDLVRSVPIYVPTIAPSIYGTE